jgi:hypothetical protein
MQFNQMEHDFSTTVLSGLEKQRQEISSSQTESQSFVLGGIGVVTRLDFPTLDELLLLERSKVIRAELLIYPSYDGNYTFDLPETISLYQTDKNNRIVSGVASSSLTVDKQYHEGTLLTFDITDYLLDELSDSYIDASSGLILTLPSLSLSSTFDRLILDAEHSETKLKIYYLSY